MTTQKRRLLGWGNRGAGLGHVALQVWRYGWASPCTLLGLAMALPLMLLGAHGRCHSGVLEVAFARPEDRGARVLGHLPFSAITFGHVVLAVTHEIHDCLRRHERVHVFQYECLGPLFLLAYPLTSLVQWSRGKRPYWDNPFEIHARAGAGREGTALERE